MPFRKNFKKFRVKTDFNSEIASSNPEKLTEQIKFSDCIYLRGGEDYRLIKILRNLKNLRREDMCRSIEEAERPAPRAGGPVRLFL